MTPKPIIQIAQTDGVTLLLFPAGTTKASGNAAETNLWLAVIRRRKVEIMYLLKAGTGDKTLASHWRLLHYSDCDPVAISRSPLAIPAAILELNPDLYQRKPLL